MGVVGYKFSLSIGIEHISIEELAQMLEKEDTENIFFVDVREVQEFNEGYIEGMVNIPLSVFEEEYNKIPRNKNVVIFCRSGNRSIQAANILKEKGYNNLTNVTGGMLEWNGEVKDKRSDQR